MENQRMKISINEEINKVISTRYPISEQIALLRQRDTKPEEFQAFFNFAEKVKADVKASRADELNAEDGGSGNE